MTVPWTSTLQKLPPIGARVLVWSSNKPQKLPEFGFRSSDGQWYCCSMVQCWPTHWAFAHPPEAPKP